MIRYKILVLLFFMIYLFLFSETLPGVQLKFTPEIGRSYCYSYSVNLDKTTLGKKANENMESLALMSVLSSTGNAYKIQYQILPVKSNLNPVLKDAFKEKGAIKREFKVSEQYEFTPEEGMSLFFPKNPVKPGSSWEGEIRFQFGDLATSHPPLMRVRFEVTKIDDDIVTLECKPVEKYLTVLMQIGVIGIRCDPKGRIEELCKDTDAEKKLKIGDVLIAINGKECITPRMRSLLAQRYVEKVNDIGSTVTLTVMRDNAKQEIIVSKFMKECGGMKVEFLETNRNINFDIKKGIMISDISNAKLSVTYAFTNDMGFADDFSGEGGMERLVNKKFPPRLYDYEWKTILKETD